MEGRTRGMVTREPPITCQQLEKKQSIPTTPAQQGPTHIRRNLDARTPIEGETWLARF